MSAFVGVITLLTVVSTGLRSAALAMRWYDNPLLEGAAVGCSLCTAVLYHLYFRAKKKDRDKCILMVGMAVDISGFTAAAVAIKGTDVADGLLIWGAVCSGILWVFPHTWKKKEHTIKETYTFITSP
tara:strand:+ start:1036 stop:1416 length:381 start_codon:yes stop_codon:yes gene_type:complete